MYFTSVQLWISPIYSSQGSTITIKYYCSSTKYIIPPEIVFTDNKNRTKPGKGMCSSEGSHTLDIIDTEIALHSLHLCGYWTFLNQSLFTGCPINCTYASPPPPMTVDAFSCKQHACIYILSYSYGMHLSAVSYM